MGVLEDTYEPYYQVIKQFIAEREYAPNQEIVLLLTVLVAIHQTLKDIEAK